MISARTVACITTTAGLCLLAISGCDGGKSGGGAASTTAGVASNHTATTASPTSSAPSVPAPRTRAGQVVARHGEGFLVVDQGRRILYTKGSAYQRGEQYGVLVGDQVEGLLRLLPAFLAQQTSSLVGTIFPLVTPAAASLFDPYIDADAREEMRGIVAGMRLRNPSSQIRESDLVFLNSFIDLCAVLNLGSLKCSSLAVWGPITEGGKLFQTRCIDLVVGTGLEQFALVTIAKPDGGVPYLNPSYAGMIGCPSGLNAHGLGVGQVWAFSNDRGFGRPWILITRELMATGVSAEDGVRLMETAQRTYGSNFVFADRGDARGGVPDARAIEVSLNHTASFGPDDPKEDLARWGGQPYAYRVPYAVFRGDCCLDPLLRSLQTASNGPTGDPRAASAYRNRYEGQATRILAHVNAGHPIGRDDVIQITKEVAMRRSSLQCCVYENTDLEVWVANARVDPQGAVIYAYDEPYHSYSLDYATPTATAVPDATSFPPGHTLRVAVPVETLGRARHLDVEVSLVDAAGHTHLLGVEALVLPERGQATAALQVAVPAGASAGQARLVVDLLEAGTRDLVDVSEVAVTVQ